MSRVTLHRPTVDPSVLIAQEWANMTWSARLLVRIASPNMAKSARYLADNGFGNVVNVPMMRARDEQPSRPGPMTRATDRMFEGSRR